MKATHAHLGEVEIDEACLELDKLDALGDERHVTYEGDIRKVTASQVCEIGRNGIHSWNPSPHISASHHPSRCEESRRDWQRSEPAALPQSLVNAVKAELIRQRAMHFVDAEKALQAAGVPALLQELRNIAFNCTDCDADEYRDWARSRARHTLRQVLGDEYKEEA